MSAQACKRFRKRAVQQQRDVRNRMRAKLGLGSSNSKAAAKATKKK